MLKTIFFILSLTMSSVAQANNGGGIFSTYYSPPTENIFNTIHSGEALPKNTILFKFNGSLNINSLPDAVDVNGTVFDTTSETGIVDLGLGFSLFEGLDWGFSLSAILHQELHPNISSSRFSSTGIFDYSSHVKYQLYNRSNYFLSTVLGINSNQVDNNPFSGENSGLAYNLILIGQKNFSSEKISFNLGYKLRSSGPKILNSYYSPLGSIFFTSVGFIKLLDNSDWNIKSEVQVSQPTGDSEANPVESEILFGIEGILGKRSKIDIGLGMGVGNNLLTPEWRLYFGFSRAFDFFNKQVPVSVKTIIKNERTYKGYFPRDILNLQDTSFDELVLKHEFQLRSDTDNLSLEKFKPPFETIRLRTLKFDFGSSTVKREFYSVLDEVVRYLNSSPRVLKVRVEGHTDSLGSARRNLIRSRERAQAVMSYLKTRINRTIQIEAKGFGSESPIADNNLKEGRESNRRVDLRILRSIKEVPEHTNSF